MDKEWKDQSADEKLETLFALIKQMGMRQNGFEFRLGDLAGEVQYLKKTLESKGQA